MPDAKPLLTILHISDLHFGDKLRGDDPERMSAKVPPLLARFPRLDGLLGHHYKALSALHDFCCTLQDERESDCLLILSGDVTATGAPTQFDLANGFIGAASPTIPYKIGLGLSDWNKWSIPGNHDQWPGNGSPFGGPTAALRTCFPNKFPVVHNLMPLRNGSSMRLILIDSDADVNPMLRDRLYARGDFVSQLSALDKVLPEIEENEFRVMVVHHSITATAFDPATIGFPRPDSKHFGELEITPRTLKVLEHALVDHDITVVLCGHMHRPLLSSLVASNDVEERTVLEARCGSTTQIDKYPYEVLKKLKMDRQLAPNTLIVHDLVEKEGSTIWRSQIYWRSKEGRFVDHNKYVTSLLPASLTREIVVLPRS